MNKQAIVNSILLALQEEFESFRNSSKKTRSEGNDTESKAEGKYDTRSIEENYLADGLAKQAQAAALAAKSYEKLVLIEFEEDAPIDIGALVQLEFPDEIGWFFLGPAGGGTEVQSEGCIITVITPESPLGSQLLDQKAGATTRSPRTLIRSVQ